MKQATAKETKALEHIVSANVPIDVHPASTAPDEKPNGKGLRTQAEPDPEASSGPSSSKRVQIVDQCQISKKKDPTEDFFDYLAKISTDEWSTGLCYLYIYKEAHKGNIRVERLYRGLSFDEFKDEIVPRHGPGAYLLQFTTRLKHLSSCSQRLVAEGGNVSTLGEVASGAIGSSSVNQPFGKTLENISEGYKEISKTAVEFVKENSKPVDVAGILTAFAAVIPKQDQTFLVTLLENQRKDAEERAERQAREARERTEREIKSAEERAARDQQFFQMIRDQDKERATEREKFYELLIKEKEKKEEDSFGLKDVLKELFSAFAQERLEGGGAGAGGWAGVLERVLPKVVDTAQAYAPLIAARLSGQAIPPAAIAAMMQQQRESGNGDHQQPTQQSQTSVPSTEQLLFDLVGRLINYLRSHEVTDESVSYWASVIYEEYFEIDSLIHRLPKEKVVEILKGHPQGQILFSTPQSTVFTETLIDEIKNPRPDDFEEATTQPMPQEMQQSKAKKQKAH